MANLSITAGSVLASANANVQRGVAGATVTAGQAVYKDTADSNKLKLSDANGVTALIRTVDGIALNGASSGQPLSYMVADSAFVPGGTLTVGDIYVLANTPGGIAPSADLVTGDYPTVIGIALSSSVMVCSGFIAGGAAIP